MKIAAYPCAAMAAGSRIPGPAAALILHGSFQWRPRVRGTRQRKNSLATEFLISMPPLFAPYTRMTFLGGVASKLRKSHVLHEAFPFQVLVPESDSRVGEFSLSETGCWQVDVACQFSTNRCRTTKRHCHLANGQAG